MVAELAEGGIAAGTEHPPDTRPVALSARTVPVVVVDLQPLAQPLTERAGAALERDEGSYSRPG